MRGSDLETGTMFSYVSLEARVPQGHPLRAMRKRVGEALKDLSPLFDALYASRMGRPSIPPERLLRALLLQVLYSICSERQLIEQLDYTLLFRWFVGLGIDDPVWDATTFTRDRDRLLSGNVAEAFFSKVLDQAKREGLISSEHFTVDGTVIEAWASQKSFVATRTQRIGRRESASGRRRVAGGVAEVGTSRCTSTDSAVRTRRIARRRTRMPGWWDPPARRRAWATARTC